MNVHLFIILATNPEGLNEVNDTNQHEWIIITNLIHILCCRL